MGTSVVLPPSSPITVSPQGAIGGPVLSAIEVATAAARANIAANLPAGAQPNAPAGGQPPVAPDPAAPVAPVVPIVPVVPGAPETPEQLQAREAAEAAAAAAAVDPLRVELPLGEGEESPLAIQADSPETAAKLAALIDQANLSTEQAITLEQAQGVVAKHNEMADFMDANPRAFIAEVIGSDLDTGLAVARYLLTQESLFNAIKPQLAKLLNDPTGNEFRAFRGDVTSQQAAADRTAESAIETGRAVRTNLQDIQTTVAAMLPEDFTQGQRAQAFQDCLRDLKDYADRNRLLTLPVHQIPEMLRARLTALGVDPEEAASRAAVAAARRGSPLTTGRGAIPAPAARRPAPVAKPAAKPTGAQFVTAAARKATVAAIPPGGAGSPTGAAGLELPRNADGTVMSGAQAIEWHRSRVTAGKRAY